MNIYEMRPTGGYLNFASFAAIGTWSDGELCSECGRSSERMIAPLQMKWESGCDEIADFSWDGPICVVVPRVWRFLRENRFECRFSRVEHVPPSGRVRKRDKRVAVPYAGPTLRWLRARVSVELDKKKNGMEVDSRCGTCGAVFYKQYKREGLLIERCALPPCKLFCFGDGGPDGVFVSEEAKQLLLPKRFTNLGFYLAGQVK
jgi:hypothetical protein